ncbi:MAG: hypothetical protein AB7E09_05210 [Candidatus Izemoplasmatales bacterium]
MNKLTYNEVQEIILNIRNNHVIGRKWQDLNCDELKIWYEDLSDQLGNIQWDLDPKNYQLAQADLVKNEMNFILDKIRELGCKN